MPLKICAAAAVFCVLLGGSYGARNERVILTPRFAAGETLTYAIQVRNSNAGSATTPITNPEGGAQSSLSISLREKLQVLGVAHESQGDTLRIHLSWEKAQADSQGDAVNPAAPDTAATYRKLEGQSLDFTLGPAGQITSLKGLDGVFPGGVPPPDAVGWLPSLVAASQFPSGGISVGQRWTAERTIAGIPLAGLFWRVASIYQRNEQCRPLEAATAADSKSPPGSAQPGECAVIFSSMAITSRKSSGSDATPDDYLHSGLRTSGKWTGTGSAIASISLADGLLTSATEASSQDMDYQIKSASTGSAIHYTGNAQSQLGITLVAAAGRPAQSSN